MNISPEVIEQIKEEQFAVVDNCLDEDQMATINSQILRYRLQSYSRRYPNNHVAKNVRQYDVMPQSQVGLRGLSSVIDLAEALTPAIQATGMNEQTDTWGEKPYRLGALYNEYKEDGVMGWHRDLSKFGGLVVAIGTQGVAQGYIGAADHETESRPPQTIVDSEPVNLPPGSALILDANARPLHQVVNVTPEGGVRSSLSFAYNCE